MAKLQAAGDPAKGGGSLQACHQSFACVKAPGLLKPWGVPAIPWSIKTYWGSERLGPS